MKTRTLIVAAVMMMSMGAAAPALAQARAGIRSGVSSEPGQFYFGGHVEMHPAIEHVTFRPNVEVGLGNGLTSVDLNIEFAYWVPIDPHPWRLYVGGGPAAVIRSVETSAGRQGHVGGGFNVLVGLQHRQGLFTELKIGFMDSPGLKFAVGYSFR